MRYRALGATGQSVSVVTLTLPAGELTDAAAYRLICVGLEQGVNSFEIADADAAAAHAVGQAIASVGRRLLVLSLRLAVSAGDDAAARVQAVLRDSGAGHFDVVMLEAANAGAKNAETAETLRREGLARLVGVFGEGDAVDQAMAQGGLDVIATTYNLTSDWPERNRIKAAAAHGLSVIGRDFRIGPERPGKVSVASGLARLFQRAATPQPMAAHAFLTVTPGWSSDQICLAYALTEPALATVQVAATSVEAVQPLCEAAERQLPAGVAAQIEIARFATPRSGVA